MIIDFACEQALSFLDRVAGAVADAASGALGGLVESVRTVFEGDPETRRKVAFSVAMIALSAKMAKADGVVTENEVDAFRDIFEIPEAEFKNVARLYNLARQDVAGYEAYAEKMAALCGTCEDNCPILEDIIDGLFHIAKADGLVHEDELVFLRRISEIFHISDVHFERILARHVHLEGVDPYKVLGVEPGTALPEIRRRYRDLVSQNHPDRLIARGVPVEFHGIANERMAMLNNAWSAIQQELRAA